MEHIKDAIQVNVRAFRRTIISLKYFPIIALILFFNMLVNLLANSVINIFSSAVNIPFLWGIVRYLVDVATLSLLMVALYRVMRGTRLDLSNFTQDWQTFMNPLMATRFIFWLIEMVIIFTSRSAFGTIPFMPLILAYAYQILLSPMLETIYIGDEQGQDAIYSIVEFLKNNFLQWIPVTIAFSMIMVQISKYSFMDILNSGSLQFIPILLIYYLMMAFVYIYKGHLYSILHNSSMRKRKFMKEVDDDLFR